MTIYPYIAVVARLADGDPDVYIYRDTTIAKAKHQTINNLRHDNDITESDVVKGYSYTQVHIDAVLTSVSPILFGDTSHGH